MLSVVISSEYIIHVIIQSCYAKCGLCTMSADKENELEFEGHMYCPRNFNVFLNVNKLIPTTNDQKTSPYISQCPQINPNHH
jgi:hypothetical protein